MKKYKKGYTTGVFDLFHIGHLNILEKAKEKCDYLIVGVSTDELVHSYKNKYPIIPFEERVRIVKSLKCVDEVIPQTNLDKMDAANRIHFDVMFHGDDWKGSDLFNDIEKNFSEKGIAVEYLPHTEGTSTTIIINKIRGKDND